MNEAAVPAGTITQAFSWLPASEVGAALRSRRRPTPRYDPPVAARAIENAPVRLSTGCALSCTVQVANHRKAIGLLYAGVQTAANAGMPQDQAGLAARP
jgi:hypothetical protein